MEHEWFERFGLTCCKRCGIVKRRDGQNKPCKGPMQLRPMEPSWPMDNQTEDKAMEEINDEAYTEGLQAWKDGETLRSIVEPLLEVTNRETHSRKEQDLTEAEGQKIVSRAIGFVDGFLNHLRNM